MSAFSHDSSFALLSALEVLDENGDLERKADMFTKRTIKQMCIRDSRYVIPADQTAPVKWNEVTTRNFTNILKKFTVTVTKSDAETGTAQGNASLAGAKYGIFKGEQLIDEYYTDENGQFTTKEYICGADWTIKELEPSEGYLLDPTVHKVGAEPELYTIEHNQTCLLYTSRCV